MVSPAFDLHPRQWPPGFDDLKKYLIIFLLNYSKYGNMSNNAKQYLHFRLHKKCYFFQLITEKVLFSVFLLDQIKSASQILNDHDNNQKGVFLFVVPGQNLEIRSQ